MRGLAKRRPFDAGFLVGVVLSGLLYTWVLSGGFPLAARPGSRQHYYTFAAVSLLHGRLDVPEQALAGECFLLDGRCYGYFGITPSLLRLPVTLVAGDRSFSDHVEAAYFLLGFLVTAAGLWWLARQLVPTRTAPTGDPWPGGANAGAAGSVAGFAVASSLAASPLLFLASRPLVYEEAILWGVAFGILALAAAVSVLRRPRPATIAILVLANLLGVLARPTAGASGILATLYVGYRLLRPREEEEKGQRSRKAGRTGARCAPYGAILVVGATAAFASAPAVAYAKFGTTTPPYRHHSIMAHSPGLLAPFSHRGGFNAAVIPTKLLSSLRPDSIRVLPSSPYVILGESKPPVVWPAKASDVVWEPTSGIPATLPFTALAAMAGLAWTTAALRRRIRARAGEPALEPRGWPGQGPSIETALVVLASACAGVGVQLAFPAQTYRYVGDWLPLLAVAAILGLGAAAAHRPPSPRRRGVLVATGSALLAAQLLIQVGLAVQNGLGAGGERPASCSTQANPYGKLGEVFCPLDT